MFPLHHLLFWGRDKDEIILPFVSSQQRELNTFGLCATSTLVLTHGRCLSRWFAHPPFNKALRNHWGSNEESLRFYVASQLPERTSEEPVKHQKCCVHNYLYEPAVLLHVLSIKEGSDLQQFLWSIIHWCEFLCVCVSSSCWLGPWMGSWGSFRPLTGFLCATTPAPASTASPSGLHEFSRPQRGPCRIH